METLQRTANRGSISTGYDIDNSVKLEADNNENFTRTPSSNSNRQTFTFSTWVKRTELGINGGLIEAYQDGANFFLFAFTTGDQIVVYNIDSSVDYGYVYTPVFRDTSAWYHIVFVSDTTNSTASDRYQLYVNGVRITDISQDYGTPPQNYNNNLNSTIAHNIGKRADGNTYNSCYLAETHLVDGTALAPTAFGEFDDDSGIWKPIEADVTYGTNGFYLDYADASDLGDDESGNGNDFTENNIAAGDQAQDSPTNNFCTINPLIPYYGSVSEGATKFIHTSGGSGWESFVATMGAGTSGKWYAEFKFVDSGTDLIVGICPIDDPDLNRGGISFAYYGSDSSLDESVGIYAANGNRYIGGGPSSYANSWSTSDIMSIAVDMDNGKLYFAKNGTWQNSGDPTSGSTGTGALDVRGATKPQSLGGTVYTAGHSALANYGGYTTISISSAASDANGYGTFEYAPPSGYYALCTKNLAEYG